MLAVETSQQEVSHLAELLDCRPDQGIMRLHEQRMALHISTATLWRKIKHHGLLVQPRSSNRAAGLER